MCFCFLNTFAQWWTEKENSEEKTKILSQFLEVCIWHDISSNLEYALLTTEEKSSDFVKIA